jgi:uncharacterized protein (TIGR02001 family)
VTAPAVRASPARRRRLREISRGALLIGCTFVPSASIAQASAAVSVFTDNRFRGYSLSDGRPVAILDLSYDHPTGLYGTVSGSVVASRGDGLRPLGLILNGGYAKRLSLGPTVDGGVTHSEYSTYSNRAAKRSYTEVYAGISGKLLTGRIYLSPDYLKHGSLYGELNGNLPVGSKLHLSAHAGLLIPLRQAAYEPYGRDVDWRIGLVRQFGPVSVQAGWTAVRPGHELYRYRYHHRDALVFGLTYSL